MTQRHRAVENVTLERIRGEFLEMPGLRLTREQAQRLWGLDAETCRQLLDILVEARFLWRTAQGAYSRLTDGGSITPRPAIARAGASRVSPRSHTNVA